jgi:hypothetical protein
MTARKRRLNLAAQYRPQKEVLPFPKKYPIYPMSSQNRKPQMSRWLIAAVVSLSFASAHAQTGNAVNSGVSSNAGTMTGPNINVVNGVNHNGTPKQQSPGASMTVGAGNSTMIPGVTGGGSIPSSPGTPPAGIATPTITSSPATTP